MDDFGGKANNLKKLQIAGFNVPSFMAIKADSRFAVRSSGDIEDSADKSFAGVFVTELDIGIEKLSDSIHNVIKSASGIKQDVNMNVVIQEYVDAKYSGVCFTELDGDIVINIHTGIGEELVSGESKGSEYALDRELFFFKKHIEIELQFAPLVTTFLKIEELFGTPQDIEFVIDKNDVLWIVQSRPIVNNL